jgi:hypothetical protein
MTRVCRAGAMLAIAAGTTLSVQAQMPNASVGGAAPATAVRTATPPRIDGRDRDEVWKAARPITDFQVFTPTEGGEPTVRTEARVLYDDRTFYVAVRAFDPRPDSIVRHLMRRDSNDPTGDLILLFIDSFHDRRSGYEFIVNAAGMKYDALMFDDSGEDPSWDGIWEVAVTVDSLGWAAEFAIPLQQLRFSDREAPTFGLMIGRWVGRTGERMSAPQYRRSVAGLASQLGTLSGLRSLSPGKSVEISPYAVVRARDVSAGPTAAGSVKSEPSVGGDIKWLARSGISVDATINPDFGQVDADPAVLNLTGVEVFQAERRPFFLEDAGLLSLPLSTDGGAQLFYSRRVGRSPSLLDALGAPDSPTQTTILGAGRVTARLAKATSLALLSALTRAELGAARPEGGRYVTEPGSHYAVARLQHDFREGRSGIGLLMTRVDRDTRDSLIAATLPRSAQVTAITAQHQSQDGSYQGKAWMALSDVRGGSSAIARLQLSPVHAFQRPDDGVEFDANGTALTGRAAYLSLAKVGGGVSRFSAWYRAISTGFDVNDMGFLTASDVQTASASAGVSFNRPAKLFGVPYRRTDASLGLSGSWSMAGLPMGRGFNLLAAMQFANLSQVQLTGLAQLPGAYCSITCTRGGPALADPPHFTLALDFTGDGRRALIPHLNVEVDADDDGRSRGFGGQADVTWRIRSNLDASLAAYAFDSRWAAYHYARFGDARSDTAHYTVARLNQPTRSLTARVNYTIARPLTVQWYSQAYVSRGAYTDVRELADPRARSWERRFRPYGDPDVSANPGGVDFKQFRSNLVLRWEYRRGSTLFVVWSQGRDVDGNAPSVPGLWPGADFERLFAARPANNVAVKWSYWLNP